MGNVTEGNVLCVLCGRMRLPLNDGAVCPHCGGTDEVEGLAVSGFGGHPASHVCPECGGTLQATECRFLSIDPDTGIAGEADVPYTYALYCENDCFAMNDIAYVPEGDDAVSLASQALDQ